MAILINKDSKVIVLGITGKSGALQRAFGENVPDSVWETIETELGKSEK